MIIFLTNDERLKRVKEIEVLTLITINNEQI